MQNSTLASKILLSNVKKQDSFFVRKRALLLFISDDVSMRFSVKTNPSRGHRAEEFFNIFVPANVINRLLAKLVLIDGERERHERIGRVAFIRHADFSVAVVDGGDGFRQAVFWHGVDDFIHRIAILARVLAIAERISLYIVHNLADAAQSDDLDSCD